MDLEKRDFKVVLDMNRVGPLRESFEMRHNDDNELILELRDEGGTIDLNAADITRTTLLITRPDRQDIPLDGSITSEGFAKYKLKRASLAKKGMVEVVAQFYSGEEFRISTPTIIFNVLRDPAAGNIAAEGDDKTLIEVVLKDGPIEIQKAIDATNAANQKIVELGGVIDENRFNFVGEVSTRSAIPVVGERNFGDAWFILDEGRTVRWNGTVLENRNTNNPSQIQNVIQQLDDIEQTKADDDAVRKKAVKIMPDDLSPETLGLVTGTGSVNVLSEPQKESVTVEKFRGKTLVRGLNIYEKPKHFTLGWIDQNGAINSSSDFGHARVPVYPNETYSFWRETGTGYGETAGLILFFDEGFNVIGSVIGDNVKNGTYLGKPVITLQTPANCYYVGVNVKMNSYDDSTTFVFIYGDKINSDVLNTKRVEKLLGAELVDTTARQAIDDFNSGIKTTGNLYKYPTHYIPDFYISNLGAIGAAAGWGYAKVPVDGMAQVSLLLPFNNYSGAIGSIGYYSTAMTMINYVVDPTVDGTYEGIGFVTLELPANTAFLIVNVKRPSTPIYDNKETLIVVEGDSVDDYSLSENVIEINNLPIQQKPSKEYEGLKWAVVGDSLTEKNIRSTRNYHSYIAEETGITVVNMGVSGTGYKRQEETNNAFYQRISNIPTDVDVVTIFGSGNDISLIANLGNATDTGTSTICGCINTTIDNLYTVLPTVPLGIIAPTPWQSTPPNVVGNNMALYVDKLEEICKLRGLPFLNLYRESGLRPWNAAYRALMYSRDDGNGVHPDENGHKLFAPNVKQFLKQLIMK